MSQFNISHLFAYIVWSIWPIDGTLSGATTLGQSGSGRRGTPYSPNFKAFRWFNVISGHSLGKRGLSPYRDAVNVFYSSSWLGWKILDDRLFSIYYHSKGWNLILVFLSAKEYLYIFTNPSTRAGYDTRSIFERSLTGLKSEFFLLLD